MLLQVPADCSIQGCGDESLPNYLGAYVARHRVRGGF